MKKNLFVVLVVLVLASLILSACGSPALRRLLLKPRQLLKSPLSEDVKKIAFFVSDLSNVFHQAQATEAQKYAMEKYGAEVTVFDGKADGAVMTQNVDQIMAQGMDAASLHIWDYDAVKPAVQEQLAEGYHPDLVLQPAGRQRHSDRPQ